MERYKNKPIPIALFPDYRFGSTSITSLNRDDFDTEPRNYILMTCSRLTWFREALWDRLLNAYANFQSSYMMYYNNLIDATRIMDDAFKNDDKVGHI